MENFLIRHSNATQYRRSFKLIILKLSKIGKSSNQIFKGSLISMSLILDLSKAVKYHRMFFISIQRLSDIGEYSRQAFKRLSIIAESINKSLKGCPISENLLIRHSNAS